MENVATTELFCISKARMAQTFSDGYNFFFASQNILLTFAFVNGFLRGSPKPSKQH